MGFREVAEARYLAYQRRFRICQDISCEIDADENDHLNYVAYIDSNKRDAWICDGCLEGWRDALEEYKANLGDFDLGEVPFIER